MRLYWALIIVLAVPRAYADTLTLRPNGNGSHTALSVSGCTNHYDCVDDVTQDGATTRVYRGSAGNAYDLYAVADHSTEKGVISSVVFYAYVGYSGTTGNATYAFYLRTNGSTYNSTVSNITLGTYYQVSASWANNPYTSSPWTWAEIDAMEAGIYLSYLTLRAGNCTQLYMVVTYTPNTPPSAAFDNNFPSLSSGTVVADYNITDAEADTCDVENRTSPETGFQYSTDRVSWHDAAMGAGGDGAAGLASAASPGADHKFAWDSAADLPDTEDASVYLRAAPYDTWDPAAAWAQSSAFAIDNKAPVEDAAVHFVSNPVSGDASFQLDVSYTDGNPGTNWYGYNLNGAGDTGAMGDADTINPSAYTFNVALDGSDMFTAIKSSHTDDMGNVGVSEDASGIYVRPLVPQAPSAAAAGWDRAEVTVNPNASENGTGLYYVIKATSGVSVAYVQADGRLGPNPYWKNNWSAPVTVTGLAGSTQYWFSVAAGNSQDPTPSAEENSASDFGPSAQAVTAAAPPNLFTLEGRLDMQGLTAQ